MEIALSRNAFLCYTGKPQTAAAAEDINFVAVDERKPAIRLRENEFALLCLTKTDKGRTNTSSSSSNELTQTPEA